MSEAQTGPSAHGQGASGIIVTICAFTMTLACILWNLDVPTRLKMAILTEQYLALELGLALCILFLTCDFSGAKTGSPDRFNQALALLGLGTLFYVAANYAWLLQEQAYRPPVLTFVGAVVTLGVLEGIRRRSGWTLFVIVGVFILYALFAHLMPGPLIGRQMSLTNLVQYVGFDPSAAFSIPLTIAAVIVLLFIFFGQLLFVAGGGEFFTDLAMAATGRTRGGSAKISVVASALFGSISGSAVSNVVTTGVITIPLMRKSGYSDKDAGAIEAIASTGGQLTPPIMGAAAFLMAEFLEVSYTKVAVAAVLPALLYYFSVFIQVDLIAARDRISVGETGGASVGEIFREGWHFVVPFAVLLGALFWWQVDPENAALLSALSIVIVGSLRSYRGRRLTPKKLFDVFVDTGVSMVDLLLIVTAAGFVIGILNVTGLGFGLTLLLVDSVGGNLILILLASAVICIILGMGMPTSGVYVLLAVLIAPSIVEAGVDPIAAHMFILYFGMMSMITPPIALAAFAAAAITRADPMQTGVASMRIGWAAYVIPFVFVATPALLFNGSGVEILMALAQTGLGVLAISVAVVGFLSERLAPAIRAVLAGLGLGCLPFAIASPVWASVNLICCVLVLAGLASSVVKARRSVKA